MWWLKKTETEFKVERRLSKMAVKDIEIIGQCENDCCSVAKSCLTLCNPKDCSTPGSSVLHYLPEFSQIRVHWVGDAIDSLQSQIVTELEENSQSVGFYSGLWLEDVTLASLLMLIFQVCCYMTGLKYVCPQGCQWGRVGQAGDHTLGSGGQQPHSSWSLCIFCKGI